MLETLTRGFRAARDQLRGATALTDENIAEALRDVRMSLLEADVDLGVVRDFLARVKQRVLGEKVETRVRDVEGVTDAVVELVWDPPWTMERLSDAAKLQMGLT